MTKEFNIAVLKGDGIGPEIINQGIKVLNAISKKYKHNFAYKEALIGGAAIEATGNPFPNESLNICKNSDAVYLGAVGHYKYDNLPPDRRPEKGLLRLRKELNSFANLRPVTIYKELLSASTIKEEVIAGVDIMIVRELTGGIYFGEPRGLQISEDKKAFNTMVYTESEIERVARVSFEIARKRRKKLCSVDKANVLETSRLWREVVTEVAKGYPDVELSHMYVDNAAMQLVYNPKQFDVMLTENMFGDILSDEASMLSGSLGMLPSASISNQKPAIYEPIHGSAPDIAGLNIANPIATILSGSMMLKYSFDLNDEALVTENAINEVLREGYRTKDIMATGMKLVSTEEMGDLITEKIFK